jgi:glycosyltransferase involved in cell wall biosynthesis
MGVPDEFFVDEDVQKNPNEIVYLGRSHSSGVDSNLGLVLSTLRFMKSLRTREIVFKSIGVSKKDLNAFWNLSQRSHQMDSGLRLEIIPNVEHTEIPKLLRTSAIGLVPYTSEGYNLERFPIKVLEYAASRTLIVASEGYKMNDLLNEERAIFFESNSTQSLAEALQRALGEDNLQRVSAAQEWARNYTYSVRAFKVLKILENET